MPVKEAITLGEFRVAEFRELPESDRTATRLEPPGKKHGPLDAMKFYKGEEFPCFFLVPEKVADALERKKTYVVTLTEKS